MYQFLLSAQVVIGTVWEILLGMQITKLSIIWTMYDNIANRRISHGQMWTILSFRTKQKTCEMQSLWRSASTYITLFSTMHNFHINYNFQKFLCRQHNCISKQLLNNFITSPSVVSFFTASPTFHNFG